jgi:hypothetical protein
MSRRLLHSYHTLESLRVLNLWFGIFHQLWKAFSIFLNIASVHSLSFPGTLITCTSYFFSLLLDSLKILLISLTVQLYKFSLQLYLKYTANLACIFLFRISYFSINLLRSDVLVFLCICQSLNAYHFI